jgi:hypothetical protein
MTPRYPHNDDDGGTPFGTWTDQVRNRARAAALKASVTTVTAALREAPADVLLRRRHGPRIGGPQSVKPEWEKT